MEDAEQMRGGESVGDLNARRERELQASRSLGDHLVERLAGDVLHDDVGFIFATRLAGSLANIVDRRDVGVVDGRGQTRLSQLRGAHLIQRERTALQQLEDDRTLQQSVRGKIHNARSAGADLANKFVVSDCATLHAPIIARFGQTWVRL